jgi:hypothetical protein
MPATDPGPPRTRTVPGLQRTVTLRFTLGCARDTGSNLGPTRFFRGDGRKRLRPGSFAPSLDSGNSLCYRTQPLWGPPRWRFGRIAQLVEQLTLNQRVPGSSPGAPTNKIKDIANGAIGRSRASICEASSSSSLVPGSCLFSPPLSDRRQARSNPRPDRRSFRVRSTETLRRRSSARAGKSGVRYVRRAAPPLRQRTTAPALAG